MHPCVCIYIWRKGVWVHLCMWLCVHVCAYICKGPGDPPRVASRITLHLIFYLRQVLSEPGTIGFSKASWLLESRHLLLCPASTGTTGEHHHIWLLTWLLNFPMQVLMLVWCAFYLLSQPPSPAVPNFKTNKKRNSAWRWRSVQSIISYILNRIKNKWVIPHLLLRAYWETLEPSFLFPGAKGYV